ncbi:MAG: DUF2069 domain-containing protein [Steroidobacteraceae bacterium]
MSDPARITRSLALAAWLALAVSIACWPLGDGAIGWPTALLALLPLLLPLPGIARGRRRSFGWAPLTLAPALAFSLTEILVNAPARWRAVLTLGLILAAFATLLAALRARPLD